MEPASTSLPSLVSSRAIMQYLVDQYAKTDTLNPRNPKKAALVNQRLFFDASTLYPRLRDYFVSSQHVTENNNLFYDPSASYQSLNTASDRTRTGLKNSAKGWTTWRCSWRDRAGSPDPN